MWFRTVARLTPTNPLTRGLNETISIRLHGQPKVHLWTSSTKADHYMQTNLFHRKIRFCWKKNFYSNRIYRETATFVKQLIELKVTDIPRNLHKLKKVREKFDF